jgi:hypothetical protein
VSETQQNKKTRVLEFGYFLSKQFGIKLKKKKKKSQNQHPTIGLG